MTIADDFQILPAVAAVDDPVAAPIMARFGATFVNLAGLSCLIRFFRVHKFLSATAANGYNY
jgi:hypothetical protein